MQVGQRVAQGTTLAKVAQPEHLKAELKVPETQAKDILIGQPASIDTHNGVITGIGDAHRSGGSERNGYGGREVGRGVAEGCASGSERGRDHRSRPIDERAFVGRPAFGQEKSTVGMFRLDGMARRHLAST